MASKPETSFSQSVHRHLPPLKELYREKMNNPYHGGTADWWYSGRRQDLWLEHKFLPRLPQKGNVWLCNPNVKQPILSRLQQDWLRGRHTEGRNVGVLVGCPLGGVILRDLTWENEIPVDLFRSLIISRQSIADWVVQEVQSV